MKRNYKTKDLSVKDFHDRKEKWNAYGSNVFRLDCFCGYCAFLQEIGLVIGRCLSRMREYKNKIEFLFFSRKIVKTNQS